MEQRELDAGKGQGADMAHGGEHILPGFTGKPEDQMGHNTNAKSVQCADGIRVNGQRIAAPDKRGAGRVDRLQAELDGDRPEFV